MGRHSRRGRAGKSDTGGTGGAGSSGTTGEMPVVPAPSAAPGSGPGVGTGSGPGSSQGAARGALGPQPPRPPMGGSAPRGVPRVADGTPAHGVPRFADGTPAHGVPRFPDGTPAHGIPRMVDGTPARGVPRLPDGTPAHGVPQARGGHPEQRESGGGWGELRGAARPTGAAYGLPQAGAQGAPRSAPLGYPGPAGPPGPPGAPGPRIPRQRQEAGPGQGPRQAYVDSFDESDDVDLFAPRRSAAHHADPYATVTDWDPEPVEEQEPLPQVEEPEKGKSGKGRAFTGIAAAAVTTVLAVVVAGQVAAGRDDTTANTQSAAGGDRDARDSASRGDNRPTPSDTASATPSAATLTYDQKMGERYKLGATLKGSGKFDAVTGLDKAPGKGQKYTYRVDVEQGLGLDAELFAQAVQKTLNDNRSWAHSGARTFERIHSGKPDFVITLASPGTTADWCAKSGLDTTVDNVSCDSASTERVMINAYRWAQGSKTYGDKIHAYRQMLINHEVGHRLGYGHVTCDKDGELAPVMQQQSKFLDHDGIHCLANPWPYPGS
ncbi:DUF3152 domain-containing protein [Streptomyces sp. SD15]